MHLVAGRRGWLRGRLRRHGGTARAPRAKEGFMALDRYEGREAADGVQEAVPRMRDAHQRGPLPRLPARAPRHYRRAVRAGLGADSRLVIERDGGICHLCGPHGADTAHHLIPRAFGGDSTDMDLLAAAHRSCNSRRGARTA
jgi:5-methylcytosine-specific restriction endonuclease McrA